MAEKFKKLISMVLSLALLASFCAVPMTASAEAGDDLKFGSDGKFKIVIFSDVQDRFPVYQRVVNIMKQAIEREKPDLVVFTGDQTEMHTTDPEVDFRRTLNQILAPVVEAGVPYAFVFGNHCDEGPDSVKRADKEALLKVYQSIGDCRTYDADPSISGTGNCKIPIYSSNGNEVAFNLWMLDSNTYYDYSDTSSGYGNPMPDQVAWMKANNDADINSLVFQHIPMPEIYNLLVEDENGAKTYGDKKYAMTLNSNASGYLGEYPCPCNYENNTGEFAVLKEMGNVLGVFTGHDHLNDFTGTYEGIDMTAVPGMTYVNYGSESVRGYGVIELDENNLNDYDYHTVKYSTLDEEAGITGAETTYDVYDVVEYSDLKENGNKLGDSYTVSGGHTLTYDATSPSKSAIFKFRWTAGTKPGFQFSFDEGENGNIANPFGVWIKRADQTGPNGAWHLKPDSLSEVKMSSAIAQGDTFDIEFGRLKVLTGEPQYVGQYYVYLKVNGTLIKEGYSHTDEQGRYISGKTTVCQTSNKIRFGGWGNGGDDVISAYVEPVTEEYAPYDVIGYDDLLDTGNHNLTDGGINITKTNNAYTWVESEAAAQTHSVILKLRWTMDNENYFQMHLGKYGSTNNFAYRMNYGNWNDRATGANIAVDPIPTQGKYYDFEVARLMVTSGANTGKYYTYFKVDGNILFEKYVAADDANTTPYLDNSIFLGFKDDKSCFISATPEPEVEEPEVPEVPEEPESIYAPYDVVEYEDFLDTGDHPLDKDGVEFSAKNTLLHYDVTSETHSVIYKFRWVSGTATYFQMFPGKYVSNDPFMYRINVSDAQWWKRYAPGSETKDIGYAINAGDEFDIEIGRLKVVSGENAGKYHSYFKVNDEEIFSVYVTEAEAQAVPDSLLDSIQFATNAEGATYQIKPIPKSDVEEPVDPNPDAPYYDYDEIEYEDLMDANGNALESETSLQGGTVLTYNKTSPTGSAIFKYRWTVGDVAKFQLSFDRYGTDTMSYMFGAQLDVDDRYPNGRMWLRPSFGPEVNLPEVIEPGSTHDVEFARLKVKNGDHKGEYYVYIKIDDVLIAESYVAADVVDANGNYLSNSNKDYSISNEILFTFWGSNGNKISAIPVPETFEEYDEITFDDLYLGEESMNGKYKDDGNHTYTYNATSPTYSVKFKYRWTAGGDEFRFTTFFDDWKYPFALAAKKPYQDDLGAHAGANGAWHLVPSNDSMIVDMDKAVKAGDTYDIEIGRLKVKTGANVGKYYVYVMVNDELIQSYYYDGVVDGAYNGTALSNKIIISSPAGNKFSAIPVPETYEEYDEITFDDLYLGEESMEGKYKDDGNHTYTYNATSSTYSVKFKYRWTAGGDEFRFTTFFDDWKYPFALAAKKPYQDDLGAHAGANGAWHLVPSNDSMIVDMDKAVKAGDTYDIEIARLKVKTGKNAGKYYVYVMVNDELIQSYYYDGVVDGAYNGTALSNKIIISSPAGNKFSAIPVPETYEEYDEIGFDDLYVGSTSMSGLEMDGKHDYTYTATSPTYSVKFKYRWIAGATPKFSTYFDAWKYPFCFAVKTPNQTGFGAVAGPNGSWHLVPSNDSMIVDMDEPIVVGQAYDIEVGRLKVKTGKNAGKYYVYFMVDGEIVQSYYYDGVVDGVYNDTALSNNIIIDAPAGNKFTAVPFVEEYEAYDEIGYEDLIDANGNPLPTGELGVKTSVFTYNQTSPTGSAILKLRWKEANAASEFQLCFDKVSSTQMAYMFGMQYYLPDDNNPNGKIWLRPGYGPQVALENAFVTGKDYNIEIARLKVKNGPNAGKYYVYFKVNDVLIAEDYVAADVVDANGNYISNPGSTSLTISNEIFLTFWGGGGNKIAAYLVKEDNTVEQQGVRGDFDGDGIINATDITIFRKILLGTYDISEMPEGIADFNADGSVDVRDLVSLKKHLAPINNYEKTGSLTLGTQEHLLEDYTKTAEYIADASATLGATSYRLSTPIHQLFYANSSNEAVLREENMNQLKEMVAALKAKGITEILYVTDSFILPYGYSDDKNHNITVPDPVDDVENYIAWLTVNANAFGKLAEEVPEIKFFEPFNEINTTGTRMERYGIGWEATEQEKANHKFTVKEKAVIMADLCYYISEAVKSVDTKNQVTSPSVVVGSNAVIENNFLDEFYKAIESGKHPTGKTLGDVKVDNYFTIVNIHAYPDYTEDDSWLGNNFESNAKKEIEEWAGHISTAYDTVMNHNDGASRVWLTETGMSTYHSDGVPRNEDNVARIIELALETLDEELTFIDTVMFYKIADISSDNGASPSETYFGLFYSGDDLDYSYLAKPSAKTIYSFFHNGSTNYSALDALVGRYAE